MWQRKGCNRWSVFPFDVFRFARTAEIFASSAACKLLRSACVAIASYARSRGLSNDTTSNSTRELQHYAEVGIEGRRVKEWHGYLHARGTCCWAQR